MAWPVALALLDWECGHLGPCAGFCGRHVRGAVQQRLTAQAVADVAGFIGDRLGGVGVALAPQVLGIVEQAVGEMIGGGPLAQAGNRGGVGIVAGGEAGAHQVAFGPQHGGKVPGLVGVEQREQLAGGGRVA